MAHFGCRKADFGGKGDRLPFACALQECSARKCIEGRAQQVHYYNSEQRPFIDPPRRLEFSSPHKRDDDPYDDREYQGYAGTQHYGLGRRSACRVSDFVRDDIHDERGGRAVKNSLVDGGGRRLGGGPGRGGVGAGALPRLSCLIRLAM